MMIDRISICDSRLPLPVGFSHRLEPHFHYPVVGDEYQKRGSYCLVYSWMYLRLQLMCLHGAQAGGWPDVTPRHRSTC